jgi:hypothetical protein
VIINYYCKKKINDNKVLFIYKAKVKGELEDEEIKADDLNSIKILNEEEMN